VKRFCPVGSRFGAIISKRDFNNPMGVDFEGLWA